MATIKNDFSY